MEEVTGNLEELYGYVFSESQVGDPSILRAL